jgi:hypothetical protein
MLKRTAIIAFILVLLSLNSFASFSLKWAETNVSLNKDGTAVVAYTIRWSASNANLHGFYFEGFMEEPGFDKENAFAVDDKGTKYGLQITKLSSRKYDIVLAAAQDNTSIDLAFENQKSDDVDVLVIRQFTTQTSGYFTNPSACLKIVDTAVDLARELIK